MSMEKIKACRVFFKFQNYILVQDLARKNNNLISRYLTVHTANRACFLISKSVGRTFDSSRKYRKWTKES